MFFNLAFSVGFEIMYKLQMKINELDDDLNKPGIQELTSLDQKMDEIKRSLE